VTVTPLPGYHKNILILVGFSSSTKVSKVDNLLAPALHCTSRQHRIFHWNIKIHTKESASDEIFYFSSHFVPLRLFVPGYGPMKA
jgi:hypothetical protein